MNVSLVMDKKPPSLAALYAKIETLDNAVIAAYVLFITNKFPADSMISPILGRRALFASLAVFSKMLDFMDAVTPEVKYNVPP